MNAGGQQLPKEHCLVLFMAKSKMSPTSPVRDEREVLWSHFSQRGRQSGGFEKAICTPHVRGARNRFNAH